MHISYAEMMRTAPDMLRMLGSVPYGQAMEAVEAFMATHAALDKGYALTRLAYQVEAPWTVSIDKDDSAELKIDLGGAPLVLYADILADAFFACHGAGGRRLAIEGTNGGWVAPYIAFRIARRGLPCSARWLAERPSKDEAAALRIVARPPLSSAGPVEVLMEEPPTSGDFEPGLRIEAGEPAEAPTAAPIDFDARTWDFITNGREADPIEHQRDFTAVAARIRVPFSERSRGQAG